MEMNIQITWLHNGFVQKRKLVNYCSVGVQKGTFITMNSPIYEAIADGSFILKTAYGNFPFSVKEWQSPTT